MSEQGGDGAVVVDPLGEVPEPKSDPDEGDAGICRTCAKPIWYEHTDRGARFLPRTGWSDRHRVDALVCFSAVHYNHEPLKGRELSIWNAAMKRAVALLTAPAPTSPGASA